MRRWLLFASPLVVMGACSLQQGGDATVAPRDGGVAETSIDAEVPDAGDAAEEPEVDAAPSTEFTELALGPTRGCAVTTTGVVKCWGNGQEGGIGDGSATSRAAPVDVVGLTAPKALAIGRDHTCAVDASGAARCWGANDSGQLGDGTNTQRLVPTPVQGLASGVSAIVAGDFHTCALTATNGVKCWGKNDHGQLGDSTVFDRWQPIDVSGLASDVVAIAAAGSHTCALTKAGAVKCWGQGDRGELGINGTQDEDVPQDAQGLTSGVAAIGAGADHSCAVLATGAMKCWGANDAGQLGDGSKTDRKTPVDVASLPGKAVAVAGGNTHTCARLDDGTVQCWGEGAQGQLGDGSTAGRVKPGPASVGGKAVEAVASGDSACARLDTGRVRCWGDNTQGQLGDGRGFSLTAIDVAAAGTGATSLVAGQIRACVLKPGSVVTCFGADAAAGNVAGLGSGVSSISVGNDHACANVGGALKCWGGNAHGQLGNNATMPQAMPVQVSNVTSGAASVSAGGEFTCGTLGTGAAKCWGKNDVGQVGDNSKMDRHVPTDVYGLTTGTFAIDTGSGPLACAILSGGSVACWGDTYGLTPTLLTGVTGATAISVGLDSACAATSSGAVSCWGANDRGQLGTANNVASFYPVSLTALAGVTAISVGDAHACAIVGGGAVKCWGANDGGQLGDGTSTDRNTPVDVTGVTGALGIAAGGSFTCALLTGGGVKCWGRAEHCQLGDCIPRGPVDLAVP